MLYLLCRTGLFSSRFRTMVSLSSLIMASVLVAKVVLAEGEDGGGNLGRMIVDLEGAWWGQEPCHVVLVNVETKLANRMVRVANRKSCP